MFFFIVNLLLYRVNVELKYKITGSHGVRVRRPLPTLAVTRLMRGYTLGYVAYINYDLLWPQYKINPFSASCIFKFSQPEPILFIEQI